MSYWLRCASSVMTMMSDRSESFGYVSPSSCPELLDQREDVAVVFGVQQLLQMFGTLGPDPVFLLNHGSRGGEIPVNLAVQIFAVGDDEERPVAGELPQNLLGEEDHRVAFAGALRVPEDAELALVRLDLLRGGDGVVHAEELMVLGDQLVGLALGLIEQREVLHEIEQARLVADAPDHGLQADHALFAFVVDLLPLGEVLPPGRHAANSAFEPFDRMMTALYQKTCGIVVL